MTKNEAIIAIANGEKVRHRSFTPQEWMKESHVGFEFEDGCLCSVTEFWIHRTDNSWNNDWSIVK